MFYTLQAVLKGKTNQAWVSHGLCFKMFSYLKSWKYVKTHVDWVKFIQGKMYLTMLFQSVCISTFHYFFCLFNPSSCLNLYFNHISDGRWGRKAFSLFKTLLKTIIVG